MRDDHPGKGPATLTCDLLIIGSGAGGLSAAVTAAFHGLEVIVAEKEAAFGGTTAWSGGWIWAPRNPLAKMAGIDEPLSAPRTYLQQVLGNNFDPERVDAFLEASPEMIRFFIANTALQFDDGNRIPDTYGHLDGAGTGGRSVIAQAYDARMLGSLIRKLARPLKETTFKGMTIQAGADLAAFMSMTRSWQSFFHVAKRVGRHFVDLAIYKRAMQLRNGQALIARLLRSAMDLGVDLRTHSAAVELLATNKVVHGAVFDTPEGKLVVEARFGVVLATGGFPNDKQRCTSLFPAGREHATVAGHFATGEGLRMAEKVGGVVDDTLAAPAAYCPVSIVPYSDGTKGVFPHIIERGKPGIIGVLRNGKRFCNEGNGYHDYVTAMLAATPQNVPVESWLICTRGFQRRYGLGIARPFPVPVGHHIRSGYIKTGGTIGELARACGIDEAGLVKTVEGYNHQARQGADPLFDRGSTPYNRLQGDATNTPNPCVSPIDAGPFFAVRVIPGSFGTFAGLKTNRHAQVLNSAGVPVEGLYAVGTDMASIMGGHYPAGGINIGPAMTFGYIAARHASYKKLESNIR